MSGRHLAFVGSGEGNALTAIAVGPGDRLDLLATVPGPPNPSFVLVGPAGRLHVTSEVEAGRVHSYAFTLASGEVRLRPIGEAPSGGPQPCHLGVDRTGRWVTVANYGDGTVAVLDAGGDDLTGPVAAATHSGSGPRSDRQAGPHAHATCFAPDGRVLVAADLGSDQLVLYGFDQTAGLTHLRSVPSTPGAGPRHVVFSRDGKHLFVVNELANTVASYAYDGSSRSLEPLDERSALPPSVSMGQAAAIRLSPNGRQLLVSNRGHDSIAAMPFDERGILGRPFFHSTGGAWPRDLALTPDHTGLVVANERSDVITLLRHDPVAGRIGPVVATVDVPSPSCVAFA